jgi:hypothetical protein
MMEALVPLAKEVCGTAMIVPCPATITAEYEIAAYATHPCPFVRCLETAAYLTHCLTALFCTKCDSLVEYEVGASKCPPFWISL